MKENMNKFWGIIGVLGGMVIGPGFLAYGLSPCGELSISILGLLMMIFLPIIALIGMLSCEEPE